MKKIKCPLCGKELIKLNFEKKCHEFWCNHCNIDITIQENEKEFNLYHKLKNQFENIIEIPSCLVPKDSVFREFIGQ